MKRYKAIDKICKDEEKNKIQARMKYVSVLSSE